MKKELTPRDMVALHIGTLSLQVIEQGEQIEKLTAELAEVKTEKPVKK